MLTYILITASKTNSERHDNQRHCEYVLQNFSCNSHAFSLDVCMEFVKDVKKILDNLGIYLLKLMYIALYVG